MIRLEASQQSDIPRKTKDISEQSSSSDCQPEESAQKLADALRNTEKQDREFDLEDKFLAEFDFVEDLNSFFSNGKYFWSFKMFKMFKMF